MIEAFKFRAVDKFLIDSIVKSQIYFSLPSQLNDPFDCRVNAQISLQRAIEMASDDERPQIEQLSAQLEGFLSRLGSDVESFGVFSFSQELLNTVMWAHYADGHRGVCLYYEIPESFMDWQSNGVIGTAPVDYGVNPVVDWLRIQAPIVNADTEEQMKIELMQRLLTVKSEDWGYEKEARLLASSPGPRDIDPVYLRQICFGLATPDSDIDLVRKLLGTEYSHVSLARVESDGTDFGIVANDI